MKKALVDYNDNNFRTIGGTNDQDSRSPFAGKELRLYHEYSFGTLYPPLSSEDLDHFYSNVYAKSRVKNQFALSVKHWFKRTLNTLTPAALRRVLIGSRYEISPENIRNVAEERAVSQSGYVAQFVDKEKVNSSLEFGAGNAALSRMLKKRLDIALSEIIEPSRERRENAKLPGELSGFYKSIHEPDRQYDLFASSHSLEHVAEIDDYLHHIDRCVRDGGYIFIEVPNCDSHYYEHDGYQLTHVHYFSADTFRSISELMGWDVIDISCFGPKIEEDRSAYRDKIYFENEGGMFLRVIFQKRAA